MANETEYANISHVTDVISDAVSAALVQGVVVAPLIYGEDLPPDKTTAVKLFRKDGYLAAETVSESAAQACDGSEQELTMTEITATAAKYAALNMLSVEAERFTPVTGQNIYDKIGQALARHWDQQIIALASGFSQGVTSSTTLTVADMLQAAYLIRANCYGVVPAAMIAVLDYKGVNEILKELITSAASAWSIPSMTSLLSGLPGTNGFRGELPGIRVYETSGLPTANTATDDCAMLFAPSMAFCSMVDSQVNYREKWLGGTDGTRGYCTERDGWIFGDVKEWNDLAGIMLKSDT
jgi:hypothetical protein